MTKKLNNLNNTIYIIIILFILIILIILCIKIYQTDTFYNNYSLVNPTTTKQLITNKSNLIDRTKLYGALFLENIEESIKNLSNPDIQYEANRIQLNNYSDILL